MRNSIASKRDMSCLKRAGRRAGAESIPALALATLWLLSPAPADAHASEQSFVLLLPTGLYTAGGIAAVALTVIALALVPPRTTLGIFATRAFPCFRLPHWAGTAASLFALALLAALVAIGFRGPPDPLRNLLPLSVWTLWWIPVPVLQAIFGDVWKWANPWTGLFDILPASVRERPFARLPDRLGSWPALLGLFAFGSFTLADPAPDNPDRLAGVVSAYWAFTFGGMVLFGKEQWLSRCECFTVLLRFFAMLAPVRIAGGECRIGFPGWAVVAAPPAEAAKAAFAIAALAFGSYDGLNETFWWLDALGLNPLEFPGRSAVVPETIAGLAASMAALCCVMLACVWAGHRFAKSAATGDQPLPPMAECFGRLALSILPIALGYHLAHYLTSFMVDGQYAIGAVSDPLGTGSDYLGLGHFYVTTGFFNTLATVRAIWLTQCAAIVAGHVVAVLLAHAIAIDLYGRARTAAASQMPLAAMMILYTLFSLWLLASPRGA